MSLLRAVASVVGSSQRTASAAAVLTGSHVLVLGLGYAWTLVIVWRFGASSSSDAYYLALAICSLVSGVTHAGLTGSVVPALAGREFRDLPPVERHRQWSAVLNLLLTALVVLGGTLLTFADVVVGLLGPGLDGQTRDVSAHLVWVLGPTIVLIPIVSFLTASLNSVDYFAAPAVGELSSGLVKVGLALALVGPLGVRALGWAFLGGVVTQLAIVTWCAYGAGFRYRPSAGLAADGAWRVGRLFASALPVSLILQAKDSLVRSLATMGGPGALTALALGLQVADLPLNLAASQIGVATFPKLARLWSGRASREFMSAAMSAIRMGLFLTIPAAAGLIILGGPVIRTVFQRAAFDEQAAQLTTLVVICYAIGLPFRGASAVLGRAVYASRDGWWLVLLIGSGFVVAIGTGSLLLGYLGAPGLALGLSVESVTTSVLLMGLLSHRLGERLDAENGRFLAKAGCAVLVMVAVIVPAQLLAERLFGGASRIESVLILGALIVVGVLVYLGASNVVRLRETAVLQDFVFARFARRGPDHS